MNDEINYKNNPLNGLGLKDMLTELVSHYGFDILFAYLNINCFKTNPSLASSVKFLKKTVWAREKVEVFYMYKYKSLPRASSEQFEIPPRDRIVPDDHKPGEPAELSLEDAEILREKTAKKTAEHGKNTRSGSGSRSGSRSGSGSGKSNGPQRSNRYSNSQTNENTGNDDNSGTADKADKEDPWAKWR
jgi:uncharacterized protein (DUF2132 family)